MVPDQFSESIGIADVTSREPTERCVTVCDVSIEKRCKTGLTIDPTLSPVNYRDSMVCYNDSTKRRYRSTVHYEPRLRPRTFSDACYIRQKRPESVFASLMESNSTKTSEPKWFSSSVHFAKVKDITCSTSEITTECGSTVHTNVFNGSANGYHADDCDDDDIVQTTKHHGNAASLRVQAKIQPTFTKPGEKILMLAGDGLKPIIMSDMKEENNNDPISSNSYKMCWNGANQTAQCDGQINRTRIRIDGAIRVN